MEKKLKLGIPKGSLQNSTIEIFGKAGFRINASERNYYPSINDPEIEVMLVRAQDMPKFVEKGVLDVGLTGRDWILENNARVVEMADFVYSKSGLGTVKWVLAVPNNSPIQIVYDLEGKAIATELVQVTKSYLKEKGVNARVEFSWGATETKAPQLVDAIVELTETGASLHANNLRIIETVLESTTKLIANEEALADECKREKIESIKTLLQAVLTGMQYVLLEMNVSKENFEKVISVAPAMKSPTIAELYGGKGYAIKIVVKKETVQKLIPMLKKSGAEDILEFELSKVVR